ncbi:MAG TPA: glycosyltransferase family 9 protein [Terriglobales bacterium]
MPERLLIVRLGSMGDVLHALPTAAALREAFPESEIGWAIERRWAPLLVADGTPLAGPRSPQRPLVDHVHVVNTLAWRKAPYAVETWVEVLNTFRGLRTQRYEVAIDFQGSIKSALVAQLAGAGSRIGFSTPREKPATMFYTSVVAPSGRHVIEQNFSLVGFLLCSSVSSVVNLLPRDPAAESSIEAKLRDIPRIALLNPGAGWGAKQWPAARYGEVARLLRDDGILSLVNYGPGEEELARAVEAASGGNARAILCTLSELIALIRRAALFIGGDTGPMHLAATLGVPVVALFGPTDPARNGPYSMRAIVLRHPASRTDMSHSAEPDPGLLSITAADVITAARRLLEVAA